MQAACTAMQSVNAKRVQGAPWSGTEVRGAPRLRRGSRRNQRKGESDRSVLVVFADFCVTFGVEQLVEVGDVGRLDAEKPAIAVGILVDGFGCVFEHVV